MKAPVAFLFLGETLLIPHLFPILEALAENAPELHVDVWVSTSVHESLIRQWLQQGGARRDHLRLRRAPGFLSLPHLQHGENPPLPPKWALLAGLAPQLLGTRVVVCAEQTSLWLPRLLPFLPWRFIKAAHGAGSMMNRRDARRRAAYRLLVPAAAERQRLVALGIDEQRIEVVGYVKSAFRALAERRTLFQDTRPVIVYAPHWQQARSSWWSWGRRIIELLVRQDRYNVILAPHQRLVEKAPELRKLLADVARLAHVHTDLDSFAMVDGSYMAAADLYLGDTSSQVVEFLLRPRPCVFLNPQGVDWRSSTEHEFWNCGEVIASFDQLPSALDRAFEHHSHYASTQAAFVASALGQTGPECARRAARCVLDALQDSTSPR